MEDTKPERLSCCLEVPTGFSTGVGWVASPQWLSSADPGSVRKPLHAARTRKVSSLKGQLSRNEVEDIYKS